jgi:hypothetical protein
MHILHYHTKMLTFGVMWTLSQQLVSSITSNILNPRTILRLHTTYLKLTTLDYNYPDFEKNSFDPKKSNNLLNWHSHSNVVTKEHSYREKNQRVSPKKAACLLHHSPFISPSKPMNWDRKMSCTRRPGL